MNIPTDKKLHFLAGFLLCIIFSIINDPITGIGAAIAGGIFKECYDHYTYGVFDWKDMIATWIGGCVAFVLYAMLVYWGIIK